MFIRHLGADPDQCEYSSLELVQLGKEQVRTAQLTIDDPAFDHDPNAIRIHLLEEWLTYTNHAAVRLVSRTWVQIYQRNSNNMWTAPRSM